MKFLSKISSIFVLLILFLITYLAPASYEIVTYKSRLGTNNYLLYEPKSREAAIFDVTDEMDTLITIISKNELNLKYIFFTHGHPDHIMGIEELKLKFPDAMTGIHAKDFDDMQIGIEWLYENFDAEEIDKDRKENPEYDKMFRFDYKTMGIPDIFVEDNQAYYLGKLKIKTLHSPGHSPGSICYYVGKDLFSGDVLFYKSVGRVDLLNSSWDDQILSVRRLYNELPGYIKVRPGHQRMTTIGYEKQNNKYITLNEVNLKKTL